MCENKSEKQVKCNDCGAYIDKINPVIFVGIFGSMELFFCGKCKKPYTKKVLDYSSIKYFATVEVDEKGKPIK